MKTTPALILGLFICFSVQIQAQRSFGGFPLSITKNEQKSKNPSLKVELKPFSNDELIDLREISDGNSLFAYPTEVSIPKTLDHTWNEIEGKWVHTIQLTSDKRSAVGISFKNFKLPKEGYLYIYNEDHQVLGAYTHANNNEHNTFFVGMIAGAKITIEYSVASPEQLQLPFEIDKVYRIPEANDFAHISMMIDTGFGASFECHENIACNTGIYNETHKRSVVRILVVLEEGLGLCTGSLLNNTAQDDTPYVLSAYHCQDGFTPRYDLWKFDFNFESETCADPSTVPSRQSIIGSEFISGYQPTDFILVKITSDIPPSYNHYLNGWDRSDDYHPEPSYLIHHPLGDIKKVTAELDDLTVSNNTVNWDNDTSTPPNSHLICDLDEGTQQPGSSGGGIFDQEGRLFGQLHGGVTDEAACDLARSYFGRLSWSWDMGDQAAARLKEWLDPLGNNALNIDGKYPERANQTISIQGVINTPDDRAVANVEISIAGMEETFLSDQNGSFSLTVPSSFIDAELSFSKNTNPGNGLSALDLVLLRRHILGLEDLEDDFKILAGDANNSGALSVLDILNIQNVILGNATEFPNHESWALQPPNLTLSMENAMNIVITAYKVGDVNCSADPQN